MAYPGVSSHNGHTPWQDKLVTMKAVAEHCLESFFLGKGTYYTKLTYISLAERTYSEIATNFSAVKLPRVQYPCALPRGVAKMAIRNFMLAIPLHSF